MNKIPDNISACLYPLRAVGRYSASYGRDFFSMGVCSFWSASHLITYVSQISGADYAMKALSRFLEEGQKKGPSHTASKSGRKVIEN